MPIAFTATVSDRDWDSEMSAWRCSALKIPGAQVDAIFVGGARVDFSWYEVLSDLYLIRWVREQHPTQAAIAIKLTEELSTKELTLRWKKLAVLLPVLSSVVVALVAAGVSIYQGNAGDAQIPTRDSPPESSKRSSPVDSKKELGALPTTPAFRRGSYRVPSNAEQIIQYACKQKWGADYVMVDYCVSQQHEAVGKLKNLPTGVPANVIESVQELCADKWAKDFVMREYCESQQFEAYRNIKQ